MYNTSTSVVTALSEDNERLRRSNNMLISELSHMRKLYNDIIYFVQNHVKPVAPSNSYSPSQLISPPAATAPQQKGLNAHQQFSNNNNNNNMYNQQYYHMHQNNNSSKQGCNNEGAKLFGVPLQCSKKRSLHSEFMGSMGMSTNKPRLVLEKDDLGLNLMPPSPC